jgi:hypothetical protein
MNREPTFKKKPMPLVFDKFFVHGAGYWFVSQHGIWSIIEVCGNANMQADNQITAILGIDSG